MSSTATEPAAEPFAGKEAGVTCPNCSRPLFSGLAEGGILICRDAEGEGCQLAVDPSNVEGLTMATNPTRMEDIVPSPEVGPPNEAAPSTEQDEQIVAAAHEPWVPPTSAPQTQNYDPDAEAAPAPAPAWTPPQQAPTLTGDGTGNGGDSSTT